jgi:hypothetical protein
LQEIQNSASVERPAAEEVDAKRDIDRGVLGDRTHGADRSVADDDSIPNGLWSSA